MEEFDEKPAKDYGSLVDAYKQAAEMDESFQQDYLDQDIDDFLDSISMVESSGGKNFDHKEIKSGIHKGHRAVGEFGLMPNTIKEIITREKRAGTLTPEMGELGALQSAEIKAQLEDNPELERQFAESLAGHVLKRIPDDEQAAYSWFQGHNLTPKQIQDRGYEDHDYVKKYKKFRKRLFGY